jgi:hypothetical protein
MCVKKEQFHALFDICSFLIPPYLDLWYTHKHDFKLYFKFAELFPGIDELSSALTSRKSILEFENLSEFEAKLEQQGKIFYCENPRPTDRLH